MQSEARTASTISKLGVDTDISRCVQGSIWIYLGVHRGSIRIYIGVCKQDRRLLGGLSPSEHTCAMTLENVTYIEYILHMWDVICAHICCDS